MDEVVQEFPNTYERQIYKLMFPFAVQKNFRALAEITDHFLIKPIVENDFALYKSPNQYSLLMMSFGYDFITEPKFFQPRVLKDFPQLQEYQ